MSIAWRTWGRSVVGGTSVVAVPAKDTSPRLIRAGSTPTNCFAAVCIALKRVGSMSRACMDSDTSTAITTVARSRGTRTLVLGAARETTSVARPNATMANARWRRQPGRLGTSDPNSATLVNRTAYALRRNCSTTYSATSAATTSNPSSHSGASNVIGRLLHCRRAGGRRRNEPRP